MKKFLILGSVLLGFGVTGLLAEDATVTLPAPAAPSPAAPATSTPAQGSTPASGKKHHKKHHKKKTGDETPAPAADPAPKS